MALAGSLPCLGAPAHIGATVAAKKKAWSTFTSIEYKSSLYLKALKACPMRKGFFGKAREPRPRTASKPQEAVESASTQGTQGTETRLASISADQGPTDSDLVGESPLDEDVQPTSAKSAASAVEGPKKALEHCLNCIRGPSDSQRCGAFPCRLATDFLTLDQRSILLESCKAELWTLADLRA